MAGFFGKRLRELRVEKNLTMRELGEKLEWSAAYICELEMGRRNPPKEVIIRKISDLFEADLNELLQLAKRDQKKVIIPLESKPDFAHNVAFNLARAIDEDKLPKEIAQKISEMLRGEGD
jgi:transcriptional regulator with XRE-family HTH domain